MMLLFVKIPLSLFLTRIISILFHLNVIKFHSSNLSFRADVCFPYLVKEKREKTIVIYINTNKPHTLGDILDNSIFFLTGSSYSGLLLFKLLLKSWEQGYIM